MTESFKELYANLQRQQEELKKQAQEAKAEAIAYVQEIITDFQIKSSDLKFADDPVVVTTVKKTRGKSPIKYRLPNGVEWTGKGNMKREVRAFLAANNMTREDLEQFLTSSRSNPPSSEMKASLGNLGGFFGLRQKLLQLSGNNRTEPRTK